MDSSTLRARLRDDFRRQFRGELLLDPTSRALYSTDASLFRIDPLAVAVPRDDEDLRWLVRYAYDRSIPLIPRGAGTGVAGESLGYGIVADLSVHFRAILETTDETVRVQAGVPLERLNAHLACLGRRLALNPANSVSGTVGGMIARDASGNRLAAHGYTRDYVGGLQVVWDDGTSDALGSLAQSRTPADRTMAIRQAMDELLQANAELIAASRLKTNFDRSVYGLRDAAGRDGPDLIRLLVGSEGTLAFTTEAVLRTIPVAAGRAAVAFGFPSFEAGLHAAMRIRETSPTACEILDQRLISLTRAESPAAAAAIPPEVEGLVLVEYERATPGEAEEAVRGVIFALQMESRQAMLVIPAFDASSADELWTFHGAPLPSLYALVRGRRPLAIVDDIAVAPDDVLDFVTRAKSALKRFDITATFLIHATTGQVQLRPFLDPDDPSDAAQLWPLAEILHGLAIEMGGTVSAQLGTGIARTPWISRQTGPLFPVYRELKRVFDPRGILNPGKIVGPDPSRPAWPLRTRIRFEDSTTTTARLDPARESPESATRLTPLLVWKERELPGALAACSGCGACRTREPARRMCPTFRATGSEFATPRAKANLFRSLLEGTLTDADSEAIRSVADLCVNCKMCATECPGRADIPKLMLEAKAADHAAHGLRRSAWFLARMDGLASVGSRFSLTANFLLRRASVRWILEKALGLSRRRTLPAFAFRTFMARARKRGLTRRPEGGPAVAYFVDTYANVFDPAVAEATIAVLRHNGVPVYVPAKQRGTGAMALAQGDTDVARERLTHNVRRLADCVRNGDTVICSEPTAALFFRLDALGLSDDADVRAVAEHTTELSAYLWSLHEQGRLRTDFQTVDLNIGHHVPCHVKALGQGVHGPALLSLIPGLGVNKIDVSCSGMAGTFGLNAKNYPISLDAGRPMLDEFSRPVHSHGSSECSACRLQMQEGTGKRALHPVQYLALAYGLMPSVADRLRQPFGGRICR